MDIVSLYIALTSFIAVIGTILLIVGFMLGLLLYPVSRFFRSVA